MRRGLSRIERYVLLHSLAAVGVALAVIASVIMLIDFVDITRTVSVHAEIGFIPTVGLMLLKSPTTILVLAPFVFLFGTVGAFVSLNRRSELIAMRAAGVSAWRFILPAAAAAFVIGIVTVAALNPMASALNARFERDREELTQDTPVNPGQLWLRQGDKHTQIVIHARGRENVNGALKLKGVSLFILTNDDKHVLEFSRRIEAAEAVLEPGRWVLNHASEATPGELALRYDSLSIPASVTDPTMMERFASPKAVPFWALPAAIVHTEQAGFSALAYRLQLQQLLALPFVFAGMTILAAAFSLRLMRLGGLASLAGSGVALGFALFFLNQVCGAMGKAGAIPPFAAAWAPPLLALLAGFTLLCYTEDG